MISKMKRTTSKANEEPTPPLHSLPIKNTTFLSRPICNLCRWMKKCLGICPGYHDMIEIQGNFRA